MQKLYFYPSAKKEGYENPYSKNYKTAISKYYEVVDRAGMQAGASFCLLCHSFLADVYIFNWIESITSLRFGKIQYWIVRLSFWIIRKRGAMMVWMQHNIHPHGGVDKYSEYIMSYMYEHTNIIVAHSKEATEYAKRRAKGVVEYICHPVAHIFIPSPWIEPVEQRDVLIWGDILPYKGVLEFATDTRVKEAGLKIFIVGKCKDEKLCEYLGTCNNDNIHYENRRASYSELKALMSKTKYVLFPYLPGSVSSSGALIDTIVLGGTPIGPNLGAFKDLAEEGVCLVYEDYEDLFSLLMSDISLDVANRDNFISSNTWDAFANKVNGLISELSW